MAEFSTRTDVTHLSVKVHKYGKDIAGCFLVIDASGDRITIHCDTPNVAIDFAIQLRDALTAAFRPVDCPKNARQQLLNALRQEFDSIAREIEQAEAHNG